MTDYIAETNKATEQYLATLAKAQDEYVKAVETFVKQVPALPKPAVELPKVDLPSAGDVTVRDVRLRREGARPAARDHRQADRRPHPGRSNSPATQLQSLAPLPRPALDQNAAASAPRPRMPGEPVVPRGARRSMRRLFVLMFAAGHTDTRDDPWANALPGMP